MNIHLLPVSGLNQNVLPISFVQHDVAVFEVRTKEGYGARWYADGSSFRGFLEPQMEGTGMNSADSVLTVQ